MHILGPSSHRPSGCSEMCRHFFLPLKTLWTYPILEPGNNLILGCSAILWYTLFNLKSNPFILKYNPLGYLYVVIFHWLSHTCTNLRASSSSQGIPRLRKLTVKGNLRSTQWFPARGGNTSYCGEHFETLEGIFGGHNIWMCYQHLVPEG